MANQSRSDKTTRQIKAEVRRAIKALPVEKRVNLLYDLLVENDDEGAKQRAEVHRWLDNCKVTMMYPDRK